MAEDKNKNKASKNPEDQKELDKFSMDLAKKITQLNNTNKNKSLLTRVNPIMILLTGIVIVFLLVGLTGGGSKQKISLGDVLNGIKDNKYSQILIQDNGSVVAREKTFYILDENLDSNIAFPDNVEVDSSSAGNIQTVNLNDFVAILKPKNVIEKIRSLVNKQSEISEILIGNNYIVGVSETGNEYYIQGVSEQDFENALKDNGISLESLGIPVEDLETFAKEINQDSLVSRIQNKEVSQVIQLDNLTIAKIVPEKVGEFPIDWVPNYSTFTDVLQNNGISLDSETFEVVSVNVPSGVTFDDILTVLTIVGFVVLAIVIFRSAQASGMGIMQFGQSKAKMFFGQKPDVTFKDVAGIDEAREELNEIVDFLRNPAKYRKLGARIPKGVLMVGAPGTGKTLLARAIAGEAAVPFFHTSGSEFEEMLVGAGASRVRDLFAKAKKAAPSLIFIDEIDAVARKRGTRIQSGTTEQTLNQILVEMDGFEKNTNVIVLAATNRPDVLDEAILRPGRFDRQVRIDMPDKDGRLAILKIHGQNKPFSADVNLEKIAKRTVGFTGADLENILNEAAIIAAKAGQTEINTKDIEEAVSKVTIGPANRSRKRTDKELELVSYHEAGHAVVAHYTKNSIPVDKISIVSRGGTGGVTMFLPEKDENIVSKGRLLADITVSLGGRAAEEVALEDISTGASNDIQQATKTVRRMIQKFGMSSKLGMIQYGESVDSEYLGYDYGDMAKEYSEKTAELIDDEVRKIVEECYINAKKILSDHKSSLDKVAAELLKSEVLEKEDFEKLLTD